MKKEQVQELLGWTLLLLRHTSFFDFKIIVRNGSTDGGTGVRRRPGR